MVTGVAAVFVVLVAGVTVVTFYAARVTRERDYVAKAEEQARQESDRATRAEKDVSRELDRAVKAEGQYREERDIAIEAEKRADTDSATATAISDFLRNDMLKFPSPFSGTPANVFVKPNPNLTFRDALDRAATSIGTQFTSRPVVEAALRETIADSYISLGVYGEAQSQLERAIELRKRAQGPLHRDTLKPLKALLELGRHALFGPPQFEELLKEIVDIENHTLGKEDSETLKNTSALAGLYLRNEKFSEAETLLLQLIAARHRIAEVPDRTSVMYMIDLIEVYEKQGKSDQARRVREKLEAGFRELGERNEITQSGLASLFTFYLDNYPERPEAEALFSRIEALSSITAMPGLNGLYGMIGLVQVYQQLGKSDQANQLAATFEAKLRALSVKNGMPIGLINNYKLRTRRSLPELVDLVNAALPEPGKERIGDIQTIRGVAVAYYDQGKYLEAERLFTRTLEVSNRLLAQEDPDTLAVRLMLAGLYLLEGKLDMSEESFNELLVVNRRASGPEAKTTLLSMTLLDWARLHQQKYIEVEKESREVLLLLEKIQPDEWERFNCLSILGASVAGQKRFADAEPLLLSAYQGMMSKQSTVARPYPIRPKLQEEGGTRIVQLYEDWGKPEKAEEWREILRVAEEHALREPLRK